MPARCPARPETRVGARPKCRHGAGTGLPHPSSLEIAHHLRPYEGSALTYNVGADPGRRHNRQPHETGTFRAPPARGPPNFEAEVFDAVCLHAKSLDSGSLPASPRRPLVLALGRLHPLLPTDLARIERGTQNHVPRGPLCRAERTCPGEPVPVWRSRRRAAGQRPATRSPPRPLATAG